MASIASALSENPTRSRQPLQMGGGRGVWTGLFFGILIVQIITIFPSFVDATPNSNSNTNPAGSASAQSCVVNPTAATAGSQKAPITALPSDEEQRATTLEVCENTKKKKKNKTKPNQRKSTTKTVATTSSSASSLSTTQSVFVRRIQSEWREAVKMGVAYDWVESKPIKKKTKKKKENKHDSSSTTEPDTTAATAEGGGGLDGEPKKQQQQQHHQYFCLGPLGNNLFVWDFTFLGMENSMYDGGLYHGRLILPPQYPSSPPRVQVWTPSGRFVPGADICLSASAFHPETWNPAAFNLRTIIESLRLHMMTPPTEIGGKKATPEKKQKLAKESRTWKQTLTVNPTRKSGYSKTVEIDHSKMIKQGMFPSLTIVAAEEEKETGNTTTATSPRSAALGLEDIITEYLEEEKDNKTIDKWKGDKTKKKRKGKRSKSKPTRAKEPVSIKSGSTGLIFLTAKTILNNRLLRMAIVFFIVFKMIFG